MSKTKMGEIGYQIILQQILSSFVTYEIALKINEYIN